jgi:alpha-glucosidase (family GH31 glycosyl hydrolase)
VAAGLNFALSGYPYWTTDVGGYWPPHDNPVEDPKYQELYARWFEYGTFCPIFRTHGHRPQNEIWAFNKVEPILINYDKLRYRLSMPASIEMKIVFVTAGHGSGLESTTNPDKLVDYAGEATSVHAP